ncbi:MAG: metallophosphoesterase [Patescibacteria group bacterium]|nr:metallophosphoesterase [Patescibacteria group bacterium]
MTHVLTVILFGLAMLAVLFASHFFVYYSLGHFFKVVSPNVSTALAISIALLATSFILASLLAHWRENIATRAFYFISGVWLGLLVNLLVAFLLSWAVFGAGKLFGFAANLSIIGVVAIILASLYAIWGVWNAFHPEIKRIEVKINNLPVTWQGKTVVQISDIHLGHVFGQKFLQKIVDQINEVKPEAVFITGDLFDGMDGRLDMHVQPLDALAAPAGVYFVTGNHETYFGVDKAKEILSKTKARILSDEVVDINGLQVVGLNYADRLEQRDLVGVIRSIPNYNAGLPAVLLYHSPIQIKKIKEAGIDLQLAGHTHRGQMFPFGWVTKMIFGGHDYGLYQEDDYSLYTTSGVGTWGPTLRTGNRPEIVVVTLR